MNWNAPRLLEAAGMIVPVPWERTLAFAAAGLAVLLAWSPVADRIASRLVAAPPNLSAFRSLQQSLPKLIAGIAIAWALGGFLEELVLRGFILRGAETLLGRAVAAPLASTLAIAAAAGIGAALHLYQGRRAALIIGQLSAMFGVLYVVSGHNLWTAILAHGLYDTIAFIRFAAKKSPYSDLGSA